MLKEDGTWECRAAFPVAQEDLVAPKILKKTTLIYTEEAIVVGIEGKAALHAFSERRDGCSDSLWMWSPSSRLTSHSQVPGADEKGGAY